MKHIRKFNESKLIDLTQPTYYEIKGEVENFEYFIEYLNDSFIDIIDEELGDVEFKDDDSRMGFYAVNIEVKLPKINTSTLEDLENSRKLQIKCMNYIKSGIKKMEYEFEGLNFKYSYHDLMSGEFIKLKTIVKFPKEKLYDTNRNIKSKKLTKLNRDGKWILK